MKAKPRSWILALLALISIPLSLSAQDRRPPHGRHPAPRDTTARQDTMAMQPHEMMQMMTGPLGISAARQGSGTAWLPDASPMYMAQRPAGRWNLGLMGNVFAHYIDEEAGERGDEEFGSANWFMGMAGRPLAGGDLMLRAMMSLDPITEGECGYPDLLATGETCDALGALHDRQHPHDLFMELAARYQRGITRGLALELYGAAVGEPAVGPVAFPHRTSAIANLFSPIGHHWQDATHIAFGVVTAGLFGRRWKFEGSVFNGREPDDERFNFDFDALDSFAGRLWFLPNERWALQVSAAHLNDGEFVFEEGVRRDITRPTASATYHRPTGQQGYWATTAIWGRNFEEGEENETDMFLLESTLNLEERNVFFMRGEVGEKTGEDLVLDVPALEEEGFTVGKLQLGYQRQFGPWGSLLPGLGASVSLSFIPDDLEPFYADRTPAGIALWASVRPKPMMTPQMAVAMARMPAPHGEMPAPEQHPERPHEMMPPTPLETTLLSLSDVQSTLGAALGPKGVHLMPGETVRHPFWSVPTVVYPLHGAKTPHAALQVNVYPTAEAAEADAARIGHDGSIGTTMPTWAAPPHFFLARNVIITLLADTARDPDVVAAAVRAVERLGGTRIAPH